MIKHYNWSVKNKEIMNLAKETLKKRNEKTYDFKLDGIDVDYILSLNVVQLREGLL